MPSHLSKDLMTKRKGHKNRNDVSGSDKALLASHLAFPPCEPAIADRSARANGVPCRSVLTTTYTSSPSPPVPVSQI